MPDNDEVIVIGVTGDVSGGRVIKQNLDDIAKSGDTATSSVQKLQKAYDSAGAAAKQIFQPQSGLSQFQQAAKDADAAAHSAQGLQLATAGATREFIVLGHEVMTGNFSRIPGSILVLGERMGGLHDLVDKVRGVFTPTVAVAVALGAAFVALAVHANEVQREMNSINVAFTANGNASQFSREEMGKYINSMSALAGVSTKDAVASLRELGGMFGLNKDQIQSYIPIIADLAAAMQTDIPKATGYFVKAMNDPITALDDLQKQFHVLTPAQLLAEENFKNTGDMASAKALLIDVLTKSFKGLHDEGLSPLDALLQTITTDFDKLNVAFGTFVANSAAYAQTKLTDGMAADTDFIGKLLGQGATGTQINQALVAKKSANSEALYDSFAASDAVDDQRALNDEITKGLELVKTLNGYTTERAQIEGQIVQLQNDENAAITAGNSAAAQRFAAAIADDQQRLAELVKRHKEQADGLARNLDGEKRIKDAIHEATVEQQRLRAEVEGPTGRAFKQLVDTVDNDLLNAFKHAFEGGKGGFKEMLDGMKKMFTDFIAEMAYRALAQPIIMPVLAAVGTSMGLSSGAVGSILGSTGSLSGGLGGIGNISSVLGLGSKISGIGSSITGAINNFGANFGFANVSGSAMGPFLPGITQGFTLSSALGYGGIGSIAAQLLGLGGGNPIVSTALGTLGGVAGGLAGSGLGTILGMAGGPVGAVLGSFAGTALSGLLGGKDVQLPYGRSGIGIGAGGQAVMGKSFSLDGQDTSSFSSAASGLLTTMNQIVTALGATGYTIDKQFSIGYNDGRGALGTGYFGGSGQGDFATGAQYTGLSSLNDAVQKTLASMLADANFQGLSPELQAIVKQVAAKGGSADDIVNNVTFAKSYLDGSLFGTEDPLTAAMDTLNQQFDAMRTQAEALGLPLDALNDAYAKQKQAVEDSIQAQKAGFQSLEDMSTAFKSFLDGEALGDDSSLSPTGKLQLAQSNFGTLLAQAQGGDLSQTQQLLTAANDLISVSRSVYASSTDFASMEAFVRSSITAIAHQAGVPGYATGTSSARSGWVEVGEQGPEIINLRGGERVYNAGETRGMKGSMDKGSAKAYAQMVSMMAEMRDEVKEMRKETRRQRQSSDRVANKLALKK